jgi:hypothetical protein
MSCSRANGGFAEDKLDSDSRRRAGECDGVESQMSVTQILPSASYYLIFHGGLQVCICQTF